jgi:hypothetical protein
MSQWTRLASTDEQEETIAALEKTIDSMDDYRICGGTTIGKSPQTVILDVTYQGSEIYIDADGEATIHDEIIWDLEDEDGIGEALKNG